MFIEELKEKHLIIKALAGVVLILQEEKEKTLSKKPTSVMIPVDIYNCMV